jgi:two-component system, chemotaxis family, CheB/CheR fusion protein
MPGMDGYEVARRIRAQPWGREATLIALTGWGQDTDRTRSREAGFDSHCVKPLDLQYLFTLLDSLPATRDAGRAPVARTSSIAAAGTQSNRNPG